MILLVPFRQSTVVWDIYTYLSIKVIREIAMKENSTHPLMLTDAIRDVKKGRVSRREFLALAGTFGATAAFA